MKKFKVTIIEEHIVEVEAETESEAKNTAEWKHDDAGDAYFNNCWIDKVEEVT